MSAPSATECHVQLFQLLPLDLPCPALGTTPLLSRFIPTSAPPMIPAVSAHSRGSLPSRCPCHELIPWEAEERLPKSSAHLSLTGIAVTAEPPPAVPTPQPAPCPRAASLQPLGEADVAPRSPGRAISSPREQLLTEARCCWHSELCWAGLALPRGGAESSGSALAVPDPGLCLTSGFNPATGASWPSSLQGVRSAKIHRIPQIIAREAAVSSPGSELSLVPQHQDWQSCPECQGQR